MKKNIPQNLENNEGANLHNWRSTSPEERRASIIQTRKDLLKNAQKYLLFMTLMSFVFTTFTLFIWYGVYEMNLMSNLAVFSGALLAGIGLHYINLNQVKASRRIQSDNFTDNDSIAYLQEKEEVNNNAMKQWDKNEKNFLFIGFVLFSLLFFRSTVEFTFLLLVSGLSVFMLGLLIFFVIRRIQNNIIKNGG